ncbi:MAG: FtsX-like permease family protein [Saprospiraceae bacterium]|nr:FtsX-like permease family protein [Saprospiraceae bacterium]
MIKWLILAWRNIWRNKRRTLISAASVAFAVMFATSMSSLQKGGWDRMLNNVVHFYFGYAQIHAEGYWDEQTIDRSLELNPDTLAAMSALIGNKPIVPRLESFALASTGPITMGVLVSGIGPAGEDSLTGLADRVIAGRYFLDGTEDGVLVAKGIAEELELSVGDTMVLLSQGYHGVSAAGKYPITGLVSFGSPDLNKLMVFMPLHTAQYFFGADGRATSLVLQLEGTKEAKAAVSTLRKKLDLTKYEVLDWEQLIPDLVSARSLDTAGSNVIILILYLIIAFGLFGTVLMMTKEREYEFGVLIAIGMKRRLLTGVVWIEILFLAAVGTVIGMLLAFPVVWYFHVHPIVFEGEMAQAYIQYGVEPIIPTVVEAAIFIKQGLIIFGMAAVMALYPLIKISTLSPVQSMRH